MLAKPWDSDALFILTNFLAKVFVHDYKLGVVPEESRELVKLMFTNLTKFANTGGEELIEEMLQVNLCKNKNLTSQFRHWFM